MWRDPRHIFVLCACWELNCSWLPEGIVLHCITANKENMRDMLRLKIYTSATIQTQQHQSPSQWWKVQRSLPRDSSCLKHRHFRPPWAAPNSFKTSKGRDKQHCYVCRTEYLFDSWAILMQGASRTRRFRTNSMNAFGEGNILTRCEFQENQAFGLMQHHKDTKKDRSERSADEIWARLYRYSISVLRCI